MNTETYFSIGNGISVNPPLGVGMIQSVPTVLQSFPSGGLLEHRWAPVSLHTHSAISRVFNSHQTILASQCCLSLIEELCSTEPPS